VPDFVPLQQLYSRALGILGVQSPGGRQTSLALAVQPVSIVSDVSDASIPHSNPIFSMVAAQGAVAVNNSQITIQATSRLLRIRQINISAGTDVRLGVVLADPLTTVVATVTAAAMGKLGPFVGTTTAIVRAGRSLAPALPGSSFLPAQAQFDFRPPLLIAPGHFVTFEDQTQNSAITVGAIWEEIPGQTDAADIGFPL